MDCYAAKGGHLRLRAQWPVQADCGLSVNLQSVPSFTAASNHANAGIAFVKEQNQRTAA